MSSQLEPLDLVVRSGRVIDISRGIDEVLDVGVRHGRIAALAPDLSPQIAGRRSDYPPSVGTAVIDAADKLVVPGLIDLHAHVYTGVCPLTVSADEVCASTGVTTIVSAGDAGAHTIEGFRRLAVEASRTRVLAFLHISTIGLAGWPEGEAHELAYLDVGKAVRAARENSDIVVGIKVREQAPLIVADNGLEPVRRAVEAGTQAGVPVMVHIGGAPCRLGELLDLLRPGDIITHSYTSAGNGIVEEGKLIPQAREARSRGVIFDVGHGFGSFAYSIVEPALAQGFWPDTISTDLHSLSATGPARDLPTTMAKFLNLGMPLTEVIRAVTARPAQVLGRSASFGTLEVGTVADIAVLDVVPSEEILFDSLGQERAASQAFRIHKTIRAGLPWSGPAPHPGQLSGNRLHLDTQMAH